MIIWHNKIMRVIQNKFFKQNLRKLLGLILILEFFPPSHPVKTGSGPFYLWSIFNYLPSFPFFYDFFSVGLCYFSTKIASSTALHIVHNTAIDDMLYCALHNTPHILLFQCVCFFN